MGGSNARVSRGRTALGTQLLEQGLESAVWVRTAAPGLSWVPFVGADEAAAGPSPPPLCRLPHLSLLCLLLGMHLHSSVQEEQKRVLGRGCRPLARALAEMGRLCS